MEFEFQASLTSALIAVRIENIPVSLPSLEKRPYSVSSGFIDFGDSQVTLENGEISCACWESNHDTLSRRISHIRVYIYANILKNGLQFPIDAEVFPSPAKFLPNLKSASYKPANIGAPKCFIFFLLSYLRVEDT